VFRRDVYDYSRISQETEAEETITLGADKDGRITSKSQVEDYKLRGEDFEDMNFLDFIVDTYEERLPRENEMDEHSYRAIDEESRNNMQGSSRRGRIPNHRSRYLESHPKRATHCRVLRTAFHNTLPSIVGPWFPSREDAHKQSLYFGSMLALLRPWRHLSQLKDDDSTWEEEFTCFVATTGQRNRDVIAGAQYYYDSKNSAEKEHEAEAEQREEPDEETDQLAHEEAHASVESANEQGVSILAVEKMKEHT
jgi:hypothetical protein